MPLRLEIKRKLTSRSDRVKCVDLHPKEPWMLAALYNGNVHIWNYEAQQLLKSFEVCDLPVRAAKFIARKNWLATGSDDMMVRIFNYNTLEQIHSFGAHSDYLRSIVVHPMHPFILTSSDDMSIKLWNWEKQWACQLTFEGHTHYVMQIVINPKDNNTFASASLDPNFTLEGHEKGVNCVDYYHIGDRPYLVSGADDRLVKIWDYQSKACVHTLEGHAQNVTAVCFHPDLPVVLTGSEDGTIRLWHSGTYRLESTLNYGLERVWTISVQRGSNNVALGYDEGSIIIKLGREEPVMSMDASGRIVWAKHSEIQQAHVKAANDAYPADGEILPLSVKDMGSCEIYPQTISHNSNGRFLVVVGDGEYIIYTAMALRNKAFGSTQEFVWGADSTEYATRDGVTVTVFQNFKEQRSFKPEFGAESMLLGIRSSTGLAFYKWDNLKLVRRIDIQPRCVQWSESGELLCIATDESYFILKYNAQFVTNSTQEFSDDGIEGAFDVIGEISEVVKTGLWVGDCFIYTNSVNRLNYYVGGEIVTIAHLDRALYLLGYLLRESRIYLGDKDLNVVSYTLLVSVLQYQTAVMRHDFEGADRLLPLIPKDQRNRVAHFLEKQGFKKQALAVSTDADHCFDLAIQLGELDVAHRYALEAENEFKWKQLAEIAMEKGDLLLAKDCFTFAKDFSGLLLLATATADEDLVKMVAKETLANGKNNVAFMAFFLLRDIKQCLEILIKTGRIAEAALFAHTYIPSEISDVLSKWKSAMLEINGRMAQALADPKDYSNLFPEYFDSLKAEKYLEMEKHHIPSSHARKQKMNRDRDPILEMKEAELNGIWSYIENVEISSLKQDESDFEIGKNTLPQSQGDGSYVDNSSLSDDCHASKESLETYNVEFNDPQHEILNSDVQLLTFTEE